MAVSEAAAVASVNSGSPDAKWSMIAAKMSGLSTDQFVVLRLGDGHKVRPKKGSRHLHQPVENVFETLLTELTHRNLLKAFNLTAAGSRRMQSVQRLCNRPINRTESGGDNANQ